MLLLTTLLLALGSALTVEVDEKGYILYCPCMGRFGNQADQFLGALAFAHDLDRTLVLPPWVEYHPRQSKSVQVPFDTYFKVEPLQKYHRVITMETFMATLAPSIWPPGKRTVYCYSSRDGKTKGTCNAKDGNPFGSFWDTFNIDFDKSEFYGPLNYDTQYSDLSEEWKERYPPSTHHVLAFTGAPGAFPVSERNVGLHKYMVWSDKIRKEAERFIRYDMEDQPFIGIHLRNGVDFKQACEHIEPQRNLFASAQCLGYHMEHGTLTNDLCYPPEKVILKQVKAIMKKVKAKALFVATDSDPMITVLKKHLKVLKVKVVRRQETNPHLDLAILAMSDHYIGNCVSSFSAFAARERLTQNKKPTSFWAFKPNERDEL